VSSDAPIPLRALIPILERHIRGAFIVSPKSCGILTQRKTGMQEVTCGALTGPDEELPDAVE
jgi:hypothetical protein